MKTWTNPTVEELEVEKTAYYYAWWQVEEANGKLDDSLFWGTEDDNGNSGGTGNEGNTGNEGGGNEEDSGFGAES